MKGLLVSLAVTAALAAGALVLVALPSAAAAKKPSPCQRLKGQDRAPSRYVKLVHRLNGRPHGRDLLGCVLPRGPVRQIATAGDDLDEGEGYERYDVEQVLGRIVVLRFGYGDRSSNASGWRVADVRTGRSYTVAESCTIKAAFSCGSDRESRSGALFVTRAGRAVVLLIPDDLAMTRQETVLAFDPGGRSRVLDSAAPGVIPPASLSLSGNIATWTNAGVARSASLLEG